jgi:Cu(I)/Ag(I) efflux system membrane fusion protein
VQEHYHAPAERAGDKDRTVLYWRDPDGKPDYSPTPTKTEDGRNYLPVYDEEEPLLPGDKVAATAKAAAKGGEREVLYYRNPMGLPDTSPVPKKDSMGMDYIPVYADEAEDSGSSVKVSLDRVQRSGVRTDKAQMRRIVRPVRAPGVAKADERTLHSVTLRADAFIEKLYVAETGAHVNKGQPLFRIYSPDMVNAQVDYRIADPSGEQKGRRSSIKGADQKLRNLEVPQDVIDEMRRSGRPVMSFDWPAPADGFVMKKNVVDGQMVRMGEEIMRLANLDKVWVIADVSERDMGLVKVGQPAKVSFKAFPSDTFEGRVTFILHELDMATRSGQVRIEIDNPDRRIKHEMYAEVEIDTSAGDAPRVSVPNSAIINSGNRQVVLVARGEGRFEPRDVTLGLRGDNYTEIKNGVADGEDVVVAANFLIDAESNLKAALSGFTVEAPAPEPVSPASRPEAEPTVHEGHAGHETHEGHQP